MAGDHLELVGDQSLVPTQERVRRSDCGDLFKTPATERMGQGGKAAAFGVGQVQPAAVEVGFEDAVFLLQIDDNPLLVPLGQILPPI